MIVITIPLSIAMLAAAIWIASAKCKNATFAWVSIVGIFLIGFCVAFSPLLIIQGLFTGLALAGCWLVDADPKIRRIAVIAPLVVAFGLAIAMGYGEVLSVHAMREDFPITSLADRLAYEQNEANHVVSSPPIVLAADVATRLEKLENRSFGNYRQYSLENLHSDTYAMFVAQQGFGSGRMLRVTPRGVELPGRPRVPLPKPSVRPDDPATEIPRDMLVAEPPVPSVAELTQAHDRGLLDFLDRERMGYVRDREHVTGFESHGFSQTPDFETAGGDQPWQITRLELVSLLKHTTPVAYVSENLPRMDDLSAAATRELDAFEQQALPRLAADEDLVVSDDDGRIRMLGSVRAGTECLGCHSVSRGSLLGAFSYELMRSPASPRQPVKRPPPEA